jgi:long-chain acyl-CoA synthetase
MMSVRETLAGKHILLTGVTGFLGKVWLAMVLEQVPEVGQITLVIRGRGRLRPGQRRFEEDLGHSPVYRRLREAHGANLGAWLAERVTVVTGDVEKPRCDLNPDDLGAMDVVVHCAGLTDFAPDPLRALAVNVAGAQHVADLARALDAKLVHVSTAFVAGMVSGAVPEHITPGVSPNGTHFSVAAEVRRLQLACRGEGRIERGMERARELGWPNLYTLTKGLAEHLLMEQPGLDLMVVRPAIVECARTFPFTGWNEGLNTAGPLAWLISTAFRRLPSRPEHCFDVVPVDDVSTGLIVCVAAALRGDAPPVVHLASGDVNPFLFGRAVELTGLAMRRWTRKGGGTQIDGFLRYLDPVPVSASAPLSTGTLRRWVGGLRSAASEAELGTYVPKAFRRTVERSVSQIEDALHDAQAKLQRVEHMLELYQPFIHDYDPRFATDHIRALSTDPEFAWTVPEIDWRHYWVDVEYPGLQMWSIPVIHGEKPPRDDVGRILLGRSESEQRVASK